MKGWRASLALRITCVLALVLALSWCVAAGLSGWRSGGGRQTTAVTRPNVLPGWQMLAIFGYALVSSLILNDTLKVALSRWRVANAASRQPVTAPAAPKGGI